jgi:hypothetical protein
VTGSLWEAIFVAKAAPLTDIGGIGGTLRFPATERRRRMARAKQREERDGTPA